MSEKKKPQKGLMINISENMHCEIKKRAAIKNMTMRQWLMQAIVEHIKWEDKYK
jgi:hypothetical protein